MKTTNILYWTFNVLLAALMLFSAISMMMNPKVETDMVVNQLHYPTYFMGLLNILKILGAITILIPAFWRLKEWAYAGFAFDLIFATYSFIKIGAPLSSCAFMLVFMVILALAYYFNIKKQTAVAV